MAAIQALRDDAVWDAMRAGSWEAGGWDPALFEACLSRSHTLAVPGGEDFSHRYPTPDEIVETLLKISVRSRYDGILALEKFENQTTVSFLKSALAMMVDGYREQEVREILTTELAFFRQRRQQHERVFRHMARLAPAFGVAGSVIGLMACCSESAIPR